MRLVDHTSFEGFVAYYVFGGRLNFELEFVMNVSNHSKADVRFASLLVLKYYNISMDRGNLLY